MASNLGFKCPSNWDWKNVFQLRIEKEPFNLRLKIALQVGTEKKSLQVRTEKVPFNLGFKKYPST